MTNQQNETTNNYLSDDERSNVANALDEFSAHRAKHQFSKRADAVYRLASLEDYAELYGSEALETLLGAALMAFVTEPKPTQLH